MKASSPTAPTIRPYRRLGAVSYAERRTFCCALITLAPSLMTGCVETGVEGPTLSGAKPLEIHAEDSGLALSVELEGGAVVRGENTLRVRLGDAEAKLTSVSAVMPAHGHDTAPPTIEVVDDGYRVTGLLLFMPGRWEVTLELDVDSQIDHAVFSADVP